MKNDTRKEHRYQDLHDAGWELRAANRKMLDAAETQLEAVSDVIGVIDEVAAKVGDDLSRANARQYADLKDEYAALEKRILGFDATDVHHRGSDRHTAKFNERWQIFRRLAYNEEGNYNEETELPEIAQVINDMIPSAATHWGATEMHELHADIRRCSHNAASLLGDVLRRRVSKWTSLNGFLPKEKRQ